MQLRWVSMGALLLVLLGCGPSSSPPHPAAVPARARDLPRYGTPEEMGDSPIVVAPPLVQVARPMIPARCAGDGLFFGRSAQTVLPQRLPARPRVVHLLREGAPPELQVDRGERRVVDAPGGSLVAIDNGEFGGGLYWLGEQSERAEALDARLEEPVRWIGETRGRIFGVSGLCHGEACHAATRSIVFDIRVDELDDGPDRAHAWRLKPLAILRGCPSAIGIGQADGGLLVATCHGLHRLDELASALVATWPTFLSPIDIAQVSGPDHALYNVSFGSLVARFGGGHEAWFSTQECAAR